MGRSQTDLLMDLREDFDVMSGEEPWPRSFHSMRCYSTDLISGRVRAQYNGQQFWLVDRRELWTYKGNPPVRARRWARLVAVVTWIALVGLILFDLYLIWLLYKRLEWLV